MRNNTMGPLSALSARQATMRSAGDELEVERREKFTFTPRVSKESSNIVKQVRRNRGTDKMTTKEKCEFLSNEKLMWAQSREAMERKKEAEEMAQCTFTPEINANQFNRKIPKNHFMKPLRTSTNTLSTEEREVLEHCTFTPQTSQYKRSQSRGKSRPGNSENGSTTPRGTPRGPRGGSSTPRRSNTPRGSMTPRGRGPSLPRRNGKKQNANNENDENAPPADYQGPDMEKKVGLSASAKHQQPLAWT